ncbi:MAG: hypothetical protein ABSF77_16845 [Spirochaetia bacterium]
MDSPLTLQSSHRKLQEGFAWAKAQALAYVFLGDPVGDWYEASLPGREAFCMRDVSHQCTGARALGLAAVTRNMFHAFARNISASRDWCTFWEIDKRGAPCSADYRDDSSFWYNLPANFDILQACFREYLWTGDRAYIDDPAFLHFYEATVSSYVDAWDKDGDGIPEHRPEYGVRGLGSYDEGRNGRACLAGGDLVALQFAAYQAYAEIIALRGNTAEAERFLTKARLLREQYNGRWWDAQRGIFSSIKLQDRSFAADFIPGIQVFPLLSGIIEEGLKTDATLDALIRAEAPNVESRSYYPEVYYAYGRNGSAYRELMALVDPGLERREYPEVSFAVLGSIAAGLMGIEPDARENLVATLPRLTRDTAWVELGSVAVMKNVINIRHEGTERSLCRNASGASFIWKAVFPGTLNTLIVDGQKTAATTGRGVNGQELSWVVVRMEPGESHTVCRNR